MLNRSTLWSVAMALVPLLGAEAQSRAATTAVAAPTETQRVAPRRTYTGGRFLLEVNGAHVAAWSYDPSTGSLAPLAAPSSSSARRDSGTRITVTAVAAVTTAAAGNTAAVSTAMHNPIPGVGVVVKRNSASGRGQGQLTLTPLETATRAPVVAGQVTSTFVLPATLSDSTFELIVTLPRDAIAAVSPGSTRGATDLVFTVSKVPGGYDVVRGSATP
jgi:hypothetical protein